MIRAGDIIFIQGRGIISSIIRWWTRSKFSHCGIAINGTQWVEAVYPRVRISTIPSNCVVMRSFASRQRLHEIKMYCLDKVGKKYDLRGLISFLLRKRLQNKSYYFCSELVAEAFEKYKVPLLRRPADMTTPQDIYQSLELEEVRNA